MCLPFELVKAQFYPISGQRVSAVEKSSCIGRALSAGYNVSTVSLAHGAFCRPLKGFGLLVTQRGRPRWFNHRNASFASMSAGLELSRRTQRRRRVWPKSLVA